MEIARHNPAGLAPPHGYTHVVAAGGGTTIYIAGQGAYDAGYALVGAGDHRAQTVQAFRNVLTALSAVGAAWADVVKATYYVVGVTPDALAAFQAGMGEALGDQPAHPAATFVGVASLAFPDMLVEIDVTAVVEP